MVTFKSVALILSLSASVAVASNGDKPKKPKTKKQDTQTKYILRQLPAGIVGLPHEAIYRLARSFDVHRWAKLMKDGDTKQVLGATQAGRTPTPANIFPFQNFSDDFKGVFEREFGVCSGFSTLQRNFNILMHFDPQNLHKAQVPKKSDKEAYYNYYYQLINKAVRFKPVIIPNFKNLNEFFSDPVLQVHAKKSIGKMWAKNNASAQGVEQFINANREFPQRKWKNLYDNLKLRLDAGYNPIIYSSFNPTETIKYNIHVIQVMKVSEYRKDGSFEIYIWDDGVLDEHFGKFEAKKLDKVITFRPDGAIWWLEDESYLNLPFSRPDGAEMMELREKELIDETLWISLLPNDDRVMTRVVANKLRWCQSKKELAKYCK